MPFIQTVTGCIPPASVRFCHCHEHLMISRGASYEVNPALCIDNYEKSLEELKTFHAAGGDTIVDAQPVGCNRMTRELVSLSRASEVQILASTGFHKMLFYPENRWIFQYTSDQLTDIFLHEIQTGMYIESDNTAPATYIDAKAGIIKCALDRPGLDTQYSRLFCAAAMAAAIAKVPMMVHIEPGSDPLMLADYLERMQADLRHVIFCHMDRACPDMPIHREICERGIYLEYDTIGRPKYHDDEKEASIFAELIENGYEKQLLFSLDTTRARLKSYTPEGVGLTYILHTFIPLLKAHGITKEQIKKISCKNCRRVLTIESY